MTVHKLRDAVVVMAGFLALIWALQVFNWADGYRLDADFGLLPQHLSRLPDICTPTGSTSRATACRCSSSVCSPPTGPSPGSCSSR
jgi:hypothetical protein